MDENTKAIVDALKGLDNKLELIDIYGALTGIVQLLNEIKDKMND